jgi:serpin B
LRKVAWVVSIFLILQFITLLKADDTGATSDGISKVVNANNQFAIDFYSNLKGKERGNLFFSPYSISTALAMTYERAHGQTAKEMQSVFHFSEDHTVRRSSFAAVYNRLNKVDARYKLRTANALWVQKDYRLLNEYIETAEKYYGGKATNVDFRAAAEEARKAINHWVEEKTNNKIKDLFAKDSLNDLTRLVLTNAIYFKGDWVKQFDKGKTKDEDFKVSKDKKIKVPMMRRTDNEAIFNYGETDELQTLEMLYEGEELSMLILLPKYVNLGHLEKSLTVGNLNQWKSLLKRQRVDVYLPKFTFTLKYTLNENLKGMGMVSAFTPPEQPSGANFSGINGKKDLFIQLVIHQAFIDVHEEGTEAAAATGVAMRITSLPPKRVPVFYADHPFIFLIQEKETGNILFMGRVINPVG